MVVLAVPGEAVVSVVEALADALAGRTVIDATNECPETRAERSLAGRVADAAPDAHVLKAFNTVGANLFLDPAVDPVSLAGDLGFVPLVAGDLSAAGRLEELARPWIDLSETYGREIAFRLLQ